MSMIGAAFYKLLDLLDRSAILLVQPLFWISLVLVMLMIVLWKWFRRSPTTPAVVKTEEPIKTEKSKDDAIAARMIQDSAQRVADSLDHARKDPVYAHRLASEGHALAVLGKKIATSSSNLSQHLGINIKQYITYASNVLNDTEDRLGTRLQGRR